MNNNNISGRRDGRDAVCSNCPVNSNPDVRQSPRRRPLSPDENQSGHQPSQSSLSGEHSKIAFGWGCCHFYKFVLMIQVEGQES